METAINNELRHEPYEFVGGPYDGRRIPVVPPAESGTELVVHTVGRMAPAEFYVLGSDGRFHYSTPPQSSQLAPYPTL